MIEEDTTDFSGQQNAGSNKGLITVIYLLVLFILVNEILSEYGYRSYGGGGLR